MPLTARLTDPGAMLATSYQLGDGSRVRLRLARPSDVALAREFFGDRSDLLARRFTFYDPRERLVLAATMLASGRERLVGLADVVFDDRPEMGVAVAGELEDSGLADLLLGAGAYARLQRRRSAA